MSNSSQVEQTKLPPNFIPTENSFTNYRVNSKYQDDYNRFGKIPRQRNRRSKYDVSRIIEKITPIKTELNISNISKDTNLSLRPTKDRTIFTDAQMLILETAYQRNNHPNNTKKEIIAKLCGLELERVKVWYQNRRAKEKRMKEDELAAITQDVESNSSKSGMGAFSLMEIQQRLNIVCDSTNTKEEQIVKDLLKESRMPAQKRKLDNQLNTLREAEELNIIKGLLAQTSLKEVPTSYTINTPLPCIDSFFSKADTVMDAKYSSNCKRTIEQSNFIPKIRSSAFPQFSQFQDGIYQTQGNLQIKMPRDSSLKTTKWAQFSWNEELEGFGKNNFEKEKEKICRYFSDKEAELSDTDSPAAPYIAGNQIRNGPSVYFHQDFNITKKKATDDC